MTQEEEKALGFRIHCGCFLYSTPFCESLFPLKCSQHHLLRQLPCACHLRGHRGPSGPCHMSHLPSTAWVGAPKAAEALVGKSDGVGG